MERLSNGIKLDIKQEKNVDKFTERQNWMRPKRPKFNNDFYYKIEDDRFYQPVVGKLINEYRNTAAFEIVNWHEADKVALKELNFRISVKKKNVVEIV